MGTVDKFCLRWNDFESNINTSFRELRSDSEFLDVTLACSDDRQIKAHKVILAACSPFFRRILGSHHHEHPLLYMKNISYVDMEAILDFMYMGEVSILQDTLTEFLAIAEDLKVKGLSNDTRLASQCQRPATSVVDVSPSKRIRSSKPYTADIHSGATATSLSHIKSETSSCGSNRRNINVTPDVSDYDSIVDSKIMETRCLVNDDEELENGLNDGFEEAYDGFSTNVYHQDVSTGNGSLLTSSAVEMINESYGVCGPSTNPVCVRNNTSFSGNLSLPRLGRTKGCRDDALRADIDSYFTSMSTRSMNGFQCLVCPRYSIDWCKLRKHLFTHLLSQNRLSRKDSQENVNLVNQDIKNGMPVDPMSVDSFPGILDRVDQFVKANTVEESRFEYTCLFCHKTLKAKFSELRVHFVAKHLKAGKAPGTETQRIHMS